MTDRGIPFSGAGKRDPDHRKAMIVERMEARLAEICKAVPPIDPPAQYWLRSDNCCEYCWPCAVKARADEFGLGMPIYDQHYRWHRTDLEDAFYDGIDGGFDCNDDHTVCCETCRRTLSYILTDYGVDEEIGYYRDQPIAVVRDEDSYALDRLALNIWPGDKAARILGVCIAVNQAWRLIRKGAAHA